MLRPEWPILSCTCGIVSGGFERFELYLWNLSVDWIVYFHMSDILEFRMVLSVKVVCAMWTRSRRENIAQRLT